MMSYVFDVDGTLTPSRGKMNKEFHDWFLNEFIPNNKVYLVTGSDYPKTVEQVGKQVCESVEYVMNCSGNHCGCTLWQPGDSRCQHNHRQGCRDAADHQIERQP